MDRWGVAGCEERFDEIVDHLCEEAKKVRIIKILGPVNRVVAIHWTRQAIDNARSNAKDIDNGDWFVAVTTAPRRDCTLNETIDSIRVAGWEPTIFAEPGSTETDAVTFHNPDCLGVWHNWLASARHAIDHSDAAMILTVQDDCGFHPDSREFIESVLWPSPDCGFVSLYTPRHYTLLRNGHTRPKGVNRIRTSSLWGACALAWPREVLRELIESPIAQAWKGAGPRRVKGENTANRKIRRQSWFASKIAKPDTIANSDTAIGKAINAMGRTMWFIDPSPVRHLATVSTIGHGGNSGNRNCLRCADHGSPLADQVKST